MTGRRRIERDSLSRQRHPPHRGSSQQGIQPQCKYFADAKVRSSFDFNLSWPESTNLLVVKGLSNHITADQVERELTERLSAPPELSGPVRMQPESRESRRALLKLRNVERASSILESLGGKLLAKYTNVMFAKERFCRSHSGQTVAASTQRLVFLHCTFILDELVCLTVDARELIVGDLEADDDDDDDVFVRTFSGDSLQQGEAGFSEFAKSLGNRDELVAVFADIKCYETVIDHFDDFDQLFTSWTDLFSLSVMFRGSPIQPLHHVEVVPDRLAQLDMWIPSEDVQDSDMELHMRPTNVMRRLFARVAYPGTRYKSITLPTDKYLLAFVEIGLVSSNNSSSRKAMTSIGSLSVQVSNSVIWTGAVDPSSITPNIPHQQLHSLGYRNDKKSWTFLGKPCQSERKLMEAFITVLEDEAESCEMTGGVVLASLFEDDKLLYILAAAKAHDLWERFLDVVAGLCHLETVFYERDIAKNMTNLRVLDKYCRELWSDTASRGYTGPLEKENSQVVASVGYKVLQNIINISCKDSHDFVIAYSYPLISGNTNQLLSEYVNKPAFALLRESTVQLELLRCVTLPPERSRNVVARLMPWLPVHNNAKFFVTLQCEPELEGLVKIVNPEIRANTGGRILLRIRNVTKNKIRLSMDMILGTAEMLKLKEKPAQLTVEDVLSSSLKPCVYMDQPINFHAHLNSVKENRDCLDVKRDVSSDDDSVYDLFSSDEEDLEFRRRHKLRKKSPVISHPDTASAKADELTETSSDDPPPMVNDESSTPCNTCEAEPETKPKPQSSSSSTLIVIEDSNDTIPSSTPVEIIELDTEEEDEVEPMLNSDDLLTNISPDLFESISQQLICPSSDLALDNWEDLCPTLNGIAMGENQLEINSGDMDLEDNLGLLLPSLSRKPDELANPLDQPDVCDSGNEAASGTPSASVVAPISSEPVLMETKVAKQTDPFPISETMPLIEQLKVIKKKIESNEVCGDVMEQFPCLLGQDEYVPFFETFVKYSGVHLDDLDGIYLDMGEKIYNEIMGFNVDSLHDVKATVEQIHSENPTAPLALWLEKFCNAFESLGDANELNGTQFDAVIVQLICLHYCDDLDIQSSSLDSDLTIRDLVGLNSLGTIEIVQEVVQLDPREQSQIEAKESSEPTSRETDKSALNKYSVAPLELESVLEATQSDTNVSLLPSSADKFTLDMISPVQRSTDHLTLSLPLESSLNEVEDQSFIVESMVSVCDKSRFDPLQLSSDNKCPISDSGDTNVYADHDAKSLYNTGSEEMGFNLVKEQEGLNCSQPNIDSIDLAKEMELSKEIVSKEATSINSFVESKQNPSIRPDKSFSMTEDKLIQFVYTKEDDIKSNKIIPTSVVNEVKSETGIQLECQAQSGSQYSSSIKMSIDNAIKELDINLTEVESASHSYPVQTDPEPSDEVSRDLAMPLQTGTSLETSSSLQVESRVGPRKNMETAVARSNNPISQLPFDPVKDVKHLYLGVKMGGDEKTCNVMVFSNADQINAEFRSSCLILNGQPCLKDSLDLEKLELDLLLLFIPKKSIDMSFCEAAIPLNRWEDQKTFFVGFVMFYESKSCCCVAVLHGREIRMALVEKTCIKMFEPVDDILCLEPGKELMLMIAEDSGTTNLKGFGVNLTATLCTPSPDKNCYDLLDTTAWPVKTRNHMCHVDTLADIAEHALPKKVTVTQVTNGERTLLLIKATDLKACAETYNRIVEFKLMFERLPGNRPKFVKELDLFMDSIPRNETGSISGHSIHHSQLIKHFTGTRVVETEDDFSIEGYSDELVALAKLSLERSLALFPPTSNRRCSAADSTFSERTIFTAADGRAPTASGSKSQPTTIFLDDEDESEGGVSSTTGLEPPTSLAVDLINECKSVDSSQQVPADVSEKSPQDFDLSNVETESDSVALKRIFEETLPVTKKPASSGVDNKNAAKLSKPKLIEIKLGKDIELKPGEQRSVSIGLKKRLNTKHNMLTHEDFASLRTSVDLVMELIQGQTVQIDLTNNGPRRIMIPGNLSIIKLRPKVDRRLTSQSSAVKTPEKQNAGSGRKKEPTVDEPRKAFNEKALPSNPVSNCKQYNVRLLEAVTIQPKSVCYAEVRVESGDGHVYGKVHEIVRHPEFKNSKVFMPERQRKMISRGQKLHMSLRNRTDSVLTLTKGRMVGQIVAKVGDDKMSPTAPEKKDLPASNSVSCQQDGKKGQAGLVKSAPKTSTDKQAKNDGAAEAKNKAVKRSQEKQAAIPTSRIASPGSKQVRILSNEKCHHSPFKRDACRSALLGQECKVSKCLRLRQHVFPKDFEERLSKEYCLNHLRAMSCSSECKAKQHVENPLVLCDFYCLYMQTVPRKCPRCNEEKYNCLTMGLKRLPPPSDLDVIEREPLPTSCPHIRLTERLCSKLTLCSEAGLCRLAHQINPKLKLTYCKDFCLYGTCRQQECTINYTFQQLQDKYTLILKEMVLKCKKCQFSCKHFNYENRMYKQMKICPKDFESSCQEKHLTCYFVHFSDVVHLKMPPPCKKWAIANSCPNRGRERGVVHTSLQNYEKHFLKTLETKQGTCTICLEQLEADQKAYKAKYLDGERRTTPADEDEVQFIATVKSDRLLSLKESWPKAGSPLDDNSSSNLKIRNKRASTKTPVKADLAFGESLEATNVKIKAGTKRKSTPMMNTHQRKKHIVESQSGVTHQEGSKIKEQLISLTDKAAKSYVLEGTLNSVCTLVDDENRAVSNSDQQFSAGNKAKETIDKTSSQSVPDVSGNVSNTSQAVLAPKTLTIGNEINTAIYVTKNAAGAVTKEELESSIQSNSTPSSTPEVVTISSSEPSDETTSCSGTSILKEMANDPFTKQIDNIRSLKTSMNDPPEVDVEVMVVEADIEIIDDPKLKTIELDASNAKICEPNWSQGSKNSCELSGIDSSNDIGLPVPSGIDNPEKRGVQDFPDRISVAESDISASSLSAEDLLTLNKNKSLAPNDTQSRQSMPDFQKKSTNCDKQMPATEIAIDARAREANPISSKFKSSPTAEKVNDLKPGVSKDRTEITSSISSRNPNNEQVNNLGGIIQSKPEIIAKVLSVKETITSGDSATKTSLGKHAMPASIQGRSRERVLIATVDRSKKIGPMATAPRANAQPIKMNVDAVLPHGPGYQLGRDSPSTSGQFKQGDKRSWQMSSSSTNSRNQDDVYIPKAKVNRPVCIHWQRGKCRYGSGCFKQHGF